MRYEPQIKIGWMVLALALAVVPCHAGEVTVSHAYNLSNFTGTIPVSGAGLAIDRAQQETYMVFQNVVRIFNSAGMQTFSFGDPEPGLLILGVTVGGDDILTLVQDFRAKDAHSRYLIQRRDYRGDLLETFGITNLPANRQELNPSRIYFRDGNLLLVDKAQLLVVEADLSGATLEVHDIVEIIGATDEVDESIQIAGFDVDPSGNMLMTIPTLFRAFVISPNGTVRSFGKSGSVAGRFGIASGITADAQGRTYVSDRLRSVVMIFDPDFNFITEFGYRGRKPENLISPSDMVIDGSGKLYITQQRNRGVSVFTVTEEVLAETVGESLQTSFNITDSRSTTTRSTTTENVVVGPDTEPLHAGLGTLELIAITDRRHEEDI